MRAIVVVGEGLGNVVMATPAAAALRAMGCRVAMAFTPRAHRWMPAFQGWSALSAVAPVDMTSTLSDADVVIRTVWGHGPRVNVGVAHKQASRGHLADMHEVDVNMMPVHSWGYCGPTPPPHVEASQRERRGMADGSYWVLATACNPGPVWQRKHWGGWAKLVRLMPGPCVFLGAAGDSREWMAHLGVDLCGKVSLREAMAWLRDARGVVGIDCGLAHCSAALLTPTVVLYGPTDEGKNRQLGPSVRLLRAEGFSCAPCQHTDDWQTCEEAECMSHAAKDVARTAVEEARAWGR